MCEHPGLEIPPPPQSPCSHILLSMPPLVLFIVFMSLHPYPSFLVEGNVKWVTQTLLHFNCVILESLPIDQLSFRTDNIYIKY